MRKNTPLSNSSDAAAVLARFESIGFAIGAALAGSRLAALPSRPAPPAAAPSRPARRAARKAVTARPAPSAKKPAAKASPGRPATKPPVKAVAPKIRRAPEGKSARVAQAEPASDAVIESPATPFISAEGFTRGERVWQIDGDAEREVEIVRVSADGSLVVTGIADGERRLLTPEQVQRRAAVA